MRKLIYASSIYAAAFSTLVVPGFLFAIPPPGALTALGEPVYRGDMPVRGNGVKTDGTAVQSAGFNAFGVSLLSHIPHSEFPGNSNGSNDCWGYVSPTGREYAIIGNTGGVGFVEVTNPTNPTVLAEIAHPASIWSDMAVYDEYCYVVNENSGGLQVIDLTLIDQGIVSEAPANPTQFTHAHNLYLNTDSGFVYPCGTNTGSGFRAYDLSDPANPTTDPSWVWNSCSAHDLYVTSYDDCPYDGRAGPCEIAFAFCGGGGLVTVDVTDKSNMFTIGSADYPTKRFTHQGYPTEDRRFLFIDDEADETGLGLNSTTYVFNIEDVGNPIYLDSFNNGIRSIDHNLYVRGDYMFAANYTSGLRIFDISDPVNGVEVGFFDTSFFSSVGFSGAWSNYPFLPSGVVLVSDGENGLFVLDVSDTTGCLSDQMCDDHNDCTIGTCAPDATCVQTSLDTGTTCNDGNNCNINGICDATGTCVLTDLNTIPCSDDSPCAGYSCGGSFCVCKQCNAVAAALPEVPDIPKSRYLTITPTNPGVATAIQVVLASLPPPFDVYNGTELWVGPPKAISENGAAVDPIPNFSNFMASPLGCDPHVMDWGSVGEIVIHHPAIVPGAQYIVRITSEACLLAGEPTYSDPLFVKTGKWGDTVSDLTQCPPGPPDGDVIITDVLAIVQRFGSQECSVPKVRADLEPGLLDLQINISDVMTGLNAFAGLPFPFDLLNVPLPCP